MANNKGMAPVPASPADVRSFIERFRTKFQQDLQTTRDIVNRLRRTEPGLRSVYKIYSRGGVQGLDELKSSRKIRLKFNDYNADKGVTEASLFETPDVVGFTIVVPYPSGITAVADVIDRAIDRREIVNASSGGGDHGTGIKTRYGRAIGSKGYLACHYNVRVPGAGKARPIVEIQIKTLLHDAWGAKTHDLTYKPSGRIGEELLTSFDLLGSNLANLDQQSDALRSSILRSAEVRDRKRRVVQLAILSSEAASSLQGVTDPDVRAELQSVYNQVVMMNADTPDEVSAPASQVLLKIFDDGAGPAGTGVAASTLLCLLAASTRCAIYFEQAQDALDVREAATTDPVERFRVKMDGMLAPFAGGDVADAIDAAEDMHAEIETIKASGVMVSDAKRFDRMRLAVLSNLAYFHADIIGSDEGQKRNSLACSRSFMAQAVDMYAGIGFPSNGLNSSDAEIIAAVSDPDPLVAAEVFFALDNEAYVGIQCAVAEKELRDVRDRLWFLHDLTPPDATELARLAVDYHDYCARARLSELESALVV